jgi:hypothetical protein
MKRILLVFALLPVLGLAAPEKIHPKTLELKSIDWYTQQAKAWSEETNRNRSHAESWFNYYAASYFSQDATAHLNQIVQDMEKAVPDSYELLVVKGWNSGYSLESLRFVQEAYAMSPEKPEAYGLLQILSELNLDAAGRATFSDQLLSHAQLSPSLLSYSYNVLMSPEPGSILITEGESTTSPLFALQDVMKVRKDVSILNLDLLGNATYLEKKFKALGLTLNGPRLTHGTYEVRYAPYFHWQTMERNFTMRLPFPRIIFLRLKKIYMWLVWHPFTASPTLIT